MLRLAIANVCLAVMAIMLGACTSSDFNPDIPLLNPGDTVRVACAGDSMTRRPAGQAYPEQLNDILGPRWDVRNFGRDGVCAVRTAGRPYWDQPEFQAIAGFEPHVVIVMLGTNDAALTDEQLQLFERDLNAMIDHFASLPTRPHLILCTPPPLMPGYNDRRMVNLRQEVSPIIRRLAHERDLSVVELQSLVTLQAPGLYPDKVHLNTVGAGIVAEKMQRQLSRIPRISPAFLCGAQRVHPVE